LGLAGFVPLAGFVLATGWLRPTGWFRPCHWLQVVGESGERIHAIIWRVAGALEQSYESALEALHAEGRMGEDACEHNAAACEALLTSLEADGLDTEQ